MKKKNIDTSEKVMQGKFLQGDFFEVFNMQGGFLAYRVNYVNGYRGDNTQRADLEKGVDWEDKLDCMVETIDKTMEDMEAKSESQFNPGPTDIMLGVLYNAIGYFIGALIFAAIFKKESPRFAPIDEDEVQ